MLKNNLMKHILLINTPIKWWIVPLAYLLSLVVLVGMPILLMNVPPTVMQNLSFVMFVVLATLLPLLFVRPVLRKHVGLQVKGDITWGRITLVTLIGYAALYLVSTIFESSSQEAAQSGEVVMRSFGFGQGTTSDILMMLAVTILAPLGEEALYRGLLFKGLFDGLKNIEAERFKKWLRPEVILLVALLISAQLFTSAHGGDGQDAQLVALFIHAIIYALIYAFSGSLIAPIMAHSLNNSTAVWQVARTASDLPMAQPALWLMYAAPFITLLLALLWRQLFSIESKNESKNSG